MARGTSILQHWEDLKSWQQDNEYILHHYRPCSGDHWKTITSLGYLHNQTVNVYSHLLGALGFCAAALFQNHFSPGSVRYSLEDRILLALFFVGVIICLASSAFLHLVSNHSHQVYNAWLTMDFFGIVCLTIGTSFPLAYYTYPCHRKTLQLCWTAVRLLLCIF